MMSAMISRSRDPKRSWSERLTWAGRASSRRLATVGWTPGVSAPGGGGAPPPAPARGHAPPGRFDDVPRGVPARKNIHDEGAAYPRHGRDPVLRDPVTLAGGPEFGQLGGARPVGLDGWRSNGNHRVGTLLHAMGRSQEEIHGMGSA